MSRALPNATLAYRPLFAGVAISSPLVKSYGTLGCFAHEPGQALLYLVTALHVLVPDPRSPPASVPVYQANYTLHGPVHDAGHAWFLDVGLDVIAVPVDPAIDVRRSIVGIGEWHGIAAPSRGMEVAKMGGMTGLTRGRISDVSANSFEIEPLPDLPRDYAICTDGDSGAAWFDPLSTQLIGIHTGASRSSGHPTVARMDRFLQQTGLAV